MFIGIYFITVDKISVYAAVRWYTH